jgi:hypothetical protein
VCVCVSVCAGVTQRTETRHVSTNVASGQEEVSCIELGMGVAPGPDAQTRRRRCVATAATHLDKLVKGANSLTVCRGACRPNATLVTRSC